MRATLLGTRSGFKVKRLRVTPLREITRGPEQFRLHGKAVENHNERYPT